MYVYIYIYMYMYMYIYIYTKHRYIYILSSPGCCRYPYFWPQMIDVPKVSPHDFESSQCRDSWYSDWQYAQFAKPREIRGFDPSGLLFLVCEPLPCDPAARSCSPPIRRSRSLSSRASSSPEECFFHSRRYLSSDKGETASLGLPLCPLLYYAITTLSGYII